MRPSLLKGIDACALKVHLAHVMTPALKQRFIPASVMTLIKLWSIYPGDDISEVKEKFEPVNYFISLVLSSCKRWRWKMAFIFRTNFGLTLANNLCVSTNSFKEVYQTTKFVQWYHMLGNPNLVVAIVFTWDNIFYTVHKQTCYASVITPSAILLAAG